MLELIIKRLSYGLLILFGVVTVVFLLFNILPGDPARMLMGQRSDVASLEAIKKDMGLDQSLGNQYLKYLNDLSPVSWHNAKDIENYFFLDTNRYNVISMLIETKKGNSLVIKSPYLRRSYQSKKPVIDIIKESLPNTIILAIAAMTFASLLGIFLGVISALNRNKFIDRALLILSTLGMSLPSFFAAILMAWLFAFVLGDYTGLNMTGNLYEIDNFGQGKFLSLKNLILPALTLGIRPLTIIIQLSRNSLLEVLSQDYVRTAKAKGLSKNRVLYKHALKNSLNPVITAISGWLASLMAGVVFVEFIFGWKGLGYIIVNALNSYDFPVVMGIVLIISVFFILINIIVDIIYGIIDPRVND